MAKISLTQIASGYDLSKINTNFQDIQDELNNKVLYRDNPVGEVNTLAQDVDANSNTIYNLKAPTSNTHAATKKYVDDQLNADTNSAAIAAAASAAAALVSENNAASSASDAVTAKTGAQAAQTAAEAARDATLAAYDQFDDRYLGSKTSDPTVDNDGNALVAGALYFNSVTQVMMLYTGSAWVAAYVSGAGTLQASNNLSDLTNVGTARTNLGLAIGVNVQAYDATILKSADIGSTVQGYDAATAKTNQGQQFTAAPYTQPLTDNDLSFDISAKIDFVCTPAGAGTLTFTGIRAGAKGEILLINSAAYAISKAATVKTPSTLLSTISATGRYRLSYSCLDGTNVDVTSSGALV